MVKLNSLDPEGVAVVFGSSGGIGKGIVSALSDSNHFGSVIGFSRRGSFPIDFKDEVTIERAAETVAKVGKIRLAVDATGFLHDEHNYPEKSWRDLNTRNLAHSFLVNAIGPALIIKHFLPRMPRSGKSVFATLSARVGSIGDNHLGGWYGYRASKAALNQIVRSASIELARRSPDAICVALHPGTVDTPLSTPFAKSQLDIKTPAAAVVNLLRVLDTLNKNNNGGFFDCNGKSVPW